MSVVTSYPYKFNLMLFKQGQLVDKAIGARPKAALEQMLNKAL